MPASISKITIDKQGSITFIYSDELQSLLALGTAEIRRASHVEPTSDGQWEADLSPSNGPKLGPFKTRGEALKAEVAWLENNNFGVPIKERK